MVKSISSNYKIISFIDKYKEKEYSETYEIGQQYARIIYKLIYDKLHALNSELYPNIDMIPNMVTVVNESYCKAIDAMLDTYTTDEMNAHKCIADEVASRAIDIIIEYYNEHENQLAYNSKYFKSKLTETTFYLLETDGSLRDKGLGITANHYGNIDLADEWKTNIGMLFSLNNEESVNIYKAIDRIYNEIIKYCEGEDNDDKL